MRRHSHVAVLLATAAAVLFLGAGCAKKPAPPAKPTPASPPDTQGSGVLFVAPAPTNTPPSEAGDVGPSAPPLPGDAAANTPPPSGARFVAPPPSNPAPPRAVAPPPSNPAPPPVDKPAPATTVAPPPEPPAPRVIRVEAKRFEFVPGEIRVQRGKPVILEVTSTDVAHGISIPELGINRRLEVGATERIDFTPEKTGRFDMICSIFCGIGHPSMRGTIVVE